MSPLALLPCPHCGSHLTERDAEGDLYCHACTRTVLDPTSAERLVVRRNADRRRPYTAMLSDRDKLRLSIVCEVSRSSVPEIVWLLLADAGALPPDCHAERCRASITVMLSDTELGKLADLGGDVPISSLVRRLIRWGLPRLERENGLRGGALGLSAREQPNIAIW